MSGERKGHTSPEGSSEYSPSPTPTPRQESVKQVIKVQPNGEECKNQPKRTNFFTIAHLYLKPAAFGRENSKAEEMDLQNGSEELH